MFKVFSTAVLYKNNENSKRMNNIYLKAHRSNCRTAFKEHQPTVYSSTLISPPILREVSTQYSSSVYPFSAKKPQKSKEAHSLSREPHYLRIEFTSIRCCMYPQRAYPLTIQHVRSSYRRVLRYRHPYPSRANPCGHIHP